MTCQSCSVRCGRFGFNRNGMQRYRCQSCGRTFSDPRHTLGGMYLDWKTTLSTVRMLVEGNSLRGTARVVGIQLKTVIALLTYVGRKCVKFERLWVRNVVISHLEMDEIWTFVGKKQRRVKTTDPATVGDTYCYIALDRASRLVVAWHIGKRDDRDAKRFVFKVRKVTARKRLQISTDGWAAYEDAIEKGLSDHTSYGQTVKVNYPGRVEPMFGNPDPSQIETTYVERFNGTLRQWCKRFARKTFGFSRKVEMLEAALALCFVYYNFCHVHGSLGTTPAVQAGLAMEPWSLEELLEEID